MTTDVSECTITSADPQTIAQIYADLEGQTPVGAEGPYEPAKIGVEAFAWELDGLGGAIDRFVVVTTGDALVGIAANRHSPVAEGDNLTREQVDNLVKAAVDKLGQDPGVAEHSSTDSGGSSATPSAPVVSSLAPGASVPTVPEVLTDALLTPDEVLSVLGEDASVRREGVRLLEQGEDLNWQGESWRLCVDQQLIPDWQAGIGFELLASDLETGYGQKLVSADPETVLAAFEAFRAVGECDAANEGAPAVGYQPASLGDDAVAWELYGGPNNVDRVVAIREGDVLMMIWALRQGDVPEGEDLTREQVDALAAAAVAKLP